MLPRALLIACVTGVIAQLALAQLPAASAEEKGQSANPGASHRLLDPHQSLLGIVLGHSSLSDVRNKLGDAPTFRAGPEEGAATEVCYKSAAKSDKTLVIFEIWAGGTVEPVTGFRVLDGSSPFGGQGHCVVSQAVSAGVATPGGLRIGVSVDRVIALLGQPAVKTKKRLAYRYHSQGTLSQEELEALRRVHPDVQSPYAYDVMITLEITMSPSGVTAFSVQRLETT